MLDSTNREHTPGDDGSAPAKSKKPDKSYLLKPGYRTTSLLRLQNLTEEEARQCLAETRWGLLGENVQQCPHCSKITSHYACPSTGGWKCRNKECAKHFTLFSGTVLRSTKMTARELLQVCFQFVEGKDGRSSRQLSGLFDRHHQTMHVLTLKIRAALRKTMLAEPRLSGAVHADAAYFLKYVRPGNVGTGAALSQKRLLDNAGLDENGKVSKEASKRMHALIVFVTAGPQGKRLYRVALVKTEAQAPVLEIAKKFCDSNTVLFTDGHSAYQPAGMAVLDHLTVDHSKEFMSPEGFHTNFAEGYFSRVRAAIRGSYHRMTLQKLEYYGWEMCWRQQMVGLDNGAQLEDLLYRLLTAGVPEEFADYWNKSGKKPKPEEEDEGYLVEVPKEAVKAKRGRPSNASKEAKASFSSALITSNSRE